MACLSLAGVALGIASSAGQAPIELKRAVATRYAEGVHALYVEIVEGAARLDARIAEFLASPTPETLEATREAWVDARRAYGESEVHRFYGGPIDDPQSGVERWINAWPVDESFLDYVVGQDDTGLVNDGERYPLLEETALSLLHQHGGETHVATGWHAIEFLLWGQDLAADGPGARPHSDYVKGASPQAERRGRLLAALSRLLLAQLRGLERAWAPGRGSYRERFLAGDPDDALRKVLTGLTVFSAFELAGERLAVAYETRDQEEEHSCFSDTTHLDLLHNQLGVKRVIGGGIADLARAVNPVLAERLDAAVERALAAVRAIPVPFDQAISGPDDAPGRRAVLAALEAIEEQAGALAELGSALGLDVPLRPAE